MLLQKPADLLEIQQEGETKGIGCLSLRRVLNRLCGSQRRRDSAALAPLRGVPEHSQVHLLIEPHFSVSELLPAVGLVLVVARLDDGVSASVDCRDGVYAFAHW